MEEREGSRVKQLLVRTGVVVLLVSIALAIFCEPLVQRFYPEFSSVLYLSAVVFFGGIGFAIMDRRPLIGALAVGLTLLIPVMQRWLVGYWDWLRHYIHTLF